METIGIVYAIGFGITFLGLCIMEAIQDRKLTDRDRERNDYHFGQSRNLFLEFMLTAALWPLIILLVAVLATESLIDFISSKLRK